MPQSITNPSTSDLLIKKSRFIGRVQPVADRVAAQQVVAASGGAQVGVAFKLPKTTAASLVANLNEARHGQIIWPKPIISSLF